MHGVSGQQDLPAGGHDEVLGDGHVVTERPSWTASYLTQGKWQPVDTGRVHDPQAIPHPFGSGTDALPPSGVPHRGDSAVRNAGSSAGRASVQLAFLTAGMAR